MFRKIHGRKALRKKGLSFYVLVAKFNPCFVVYAMFPEYVESSSRNLQIGLQMICFMANKIGLDVSFPSCVIRSLNLEVN